MQRRNIPAQLSSLTIFPFPFMHEVFGVEFFARRQKIVLIVFSGGMYVGENTESDGKRIRAGFFGRIYARTALLPLTIQTRIACGQCLVRTKIRSGKTALHISVRNVRDISCAEDAGLLTQAKDDKPERARQFR